MRRLIFLLLFVLATGLAACSRGEPQLTVEDARGQPPVATVQLDLGDVPNGEIVTRNVPVRNAGDAVLVVENISTSCGCTSATLDPMQLVPGESGTLRIAYDAGAHGPELTGPMVRQVFINSNDPAQPEVIVELAVNVTPPLQAESEGR